MGGKKKYLLILSAIPIYVFYCYFSVVFLKIDFNLSDIICVSVFVVNAVVILSGKNKVITITCCIVFHTILLCVFFWAGEFVNISLQQIFIYCLFCLPPLFILAMSAGAVNKEKNHKEKNNMFSHHALLFDGLMATLFVIFIIASVKGGFNIAFVFDAVSVTLLLVFVVLLGFNIALAINKKTKNSPLRAYGYMLSVNSFFDFLLYSLWAHSYVHDRVYLVFPVFLTFIYLSHTFNMMDYFKQKTLFGREK